jgi:hypothetical protein
MSKFYTPGTDGFHVAVLRADADHQVLLIERKSSAEADAPDQPIYWGNDELGTLTAEDDSALRTVLPLALRPTTPPAGTAGPAPENRSLQVPPVLWAILGSLLTTLVLVLSGYQ